MRSVIFDLDGTLADTSGDLLAAANACFRGLGLGDLIGPADAGTALKGGRAMLRLGFSRVAGFGEAEVDAQNGPPRGGRSETIAFGRRHENRSRYVTQCGRAVYLGHLWAGR